MLLPTTVNKSNVHGGYDTYNDEEEFTDRYTMLPISAVVVNILANPLRSCLRNRNVHTIVVYHCVF